SMAPFSGPMCWRTPFSDSLSSSTGEIIAGRSLAAYSPLRSWSACWRWPYPPFSYYGFDPPSVPPESTPMAHRIDLLVEGNGSPRLDRYLMFHLPGESRTSVQRLILDGHVHREGKALKPSSRLHPGERLVVVIPDPCPSHLAPESIPLEIIHRDPAFLVVSKPAGMVVHPGAGRRSG